MAASRLLSSDHAAPGAARAAMRRAMFFSQDGVMLSATLRALDEIGVLESSLAAERSVADLHPGLSERGFGALRAGLRCLASVGWLSGEPTLDPGATILRWTDGGRLAMRHRDRYVASGRFLAEFPSTAPDAWTRSWESGRTEPFLELVASATDRWRLDDLPDELAALVTAHLDGGLVVPTITWLHETGRIGAAEPFLPRGDAGDGMGSLLGAVGFVDPPHGDWTESGLLARDFALSFAMVATYLPLLARLPQLYRGELAVEREPGTSATEWHVHRGLNLSVSTNAHRRYFTDADAVFLDIFDRPMDERPRFIADMGCGDGTWLVHLHRLLGERTGDPPLMVGIDSSPTALARAGETLDAAGVPALLLPGDVTDPDGLSASLAEHGLRIEDGLHVRAFLDHERAYLGADPDVPVPGWSSGAYVDRDGRPLGPADAERDLVTHLERWARHVGRHGMVVMEAHCVAPQIAARHLGALHSVAFDAYHAYSRQAPIDHAAFVRCCQQSGLLSHGRHERRYPARRPFVGVSLNRLLGPGADATLPAMGAHSAREDTWRPDPDADLVDGRALHELLFAGGDVRRPRPWCSAPTGFVVAGALGAIEERLADARDGDAIRVLDYGAGTGTATIELLKACRERGVDRRLECRGATLEIHMADLPSSWFAQGHALLGECAWTRFHSLRGEDGGFRALRDVTAGRPMDAVMANMVFHLIPGRVLGRAADELASVIAPGGRVVWSSPDLGPPGRYSVLLHDPNRALRRRWLELLAGVEGVGPTGTVREAVDEARRTLEPEAMRAAQERADRRILAEPLDAADVADALSKHFAGEVEVRDHEMLDEEFLEALLVPSNQAEYLPEIPERSVREEVIRELMLGEVLPAMQEGPAGTGTGLSVRWTLGAFTKRE